MNKLLLALIFGMILVLPIYAEQSLPQPIKQYSCANLTQSCSNCSFVTITSVLYPDNSKEIMNLNMSKIETDYTLEFCNTSQLGSYIYNTFGNPDGIGTTQPINFQVTPTGESLDTSKGLLYLVILFFSMIIFGITIYGAIKFPWRNDRDDEGKILSINNFKYLKVILYICAYLEFLFLVSIMKNMAGGFMTIGGTYEFFNILYNLMLIALLPMFPCLIAFTIIIWLSDKKVQSNLERGINYE